MPRSARPLRRFLDVISRIGKLEGSRIGKLEGSEVPVSWMVQRYLIPHFKRPSFKLDPRLVDRIIEQNAEQIAWMSEKLGFDLGTIGRDTDEAPRQHEPIDDDMDRFLFALVSNSPR
jgi:hypothetical protein